MWPPTAAWQARIDRFQNSDKWIRNHPPYPVAGSARYRSATRCLAAAPLARQRPAGDSVPVAGDIRGMARILADSWQAKKMTAFGMSTDMIDQLYDVARANGALAGKVSGAGGGGFIMFIVNPEDRLELLNALNEAGGSAWPVKFTERGCETWQVRR